MRKVIILVALLLPFMLQSQMLKPTGNSRTVEQAFMTIYSTKMYRGYVYQEEYTIQQKWGPGFNIWINKKYCRKRLIGRKWYKPKEIYQYNL